MVSLQVSPTFKKNNQPFVRHDSVWVGNLPHLLAQTKRLKRLRSKIHKFVHPASGLDRGLLGDGLFKKVKRKYFNSRN